MIDVIDVIDVTDVHMFSVVLSLPVAICQSIR